MCLILIPELLQDIFHPSLYFVTGNLIFKERHFTFNLLKSSTFLEFTSSGQIHSFGINP